ncbi:hypothetical protein ACJJIG_17480 [Microbulbifer sp. SSSA007]|uniref:hypothetical protein n=1 Tax=Microbulbifer sp. SSSA007 TaxID=3243379 RepID=UPI0040394966
MLDLRRFAAPTRAAVGGLIGGIAYAATSDNFSWGELAGNVATGAVVGGLTAAVPGYIATNALSFGGRVGNFSASVGTATAAGAAGDAANQYMAGGEIDSGKALLAGVANAAGMVGGQVVQPFAKATTTVTLPAKEGFSVNSLSGKTFQTGAAPAIDVPSPGAQQILQDSAGGTATALINEKMNSN